MIITPRSFSFTIQDLKPRKALNKYLQGILKPIDYLNRCTTIEAKGNKVKLFILQPNKMFNNRNVKTKLFRKTWSFGTKGRFVESGDVKGAL